MESSGQLVSEFELDVDCSDEDETTMQTCEFVGTVTAWEDPEAGTWGWTCPVCGCEHYDYLSEVTDGGEDEYDWD